GNAYHLRGVPSAVGVSSDHAIGNAFRDERMRLTGRGAVADGLQVSCDLTGEHFYEARTEHAGCNALIGDGLQRDGPPKFVDRTLRRQEIRAVKCGEIETLSEDEHVSHAVAVAARNTKRLGVATRAGVGVGRGHTIEVSWKQQRLRRIGQRSARALGERPPTAFLVGPNRCEDLVAEIDEVWHG